MAEEQKVEIQEIEAAFRQWLQATGRHLFSDNPSVSPDRFPFHAGYAACIAKLKAKASPPGGTS